MRGELVGYWGSLIQADDAGLHGALGEIIDQMTVFIKYREKYYGITATTEMQLLLNYLDQNAVAAIKIKLTVYKDWWSANKSNPISLP